MQKMNQGPIGIFDSGFGGLTVFKSIYELLPQYNYTYLGDNARVPYGNRSFETVYQYTKECVFKLFEMGCPLVIVACNTASAKALRSIQLNDLPPGKKILGVIRPTTEIIDQYTKSGHVGILATQGTVRSDSYKIEIQRFHPNITVHQHACPVWVPLVENNDLDSDGTNFFVKEDVEALLSQSPDIDTILLACTHYPLLLPAIQKHTPKHIKLLAQGELVANSLADYLNRHPEIERQCQRGDTNTFYTTDDPIDFQEKAKLFFGREIAALHTAVEAID